MDQKKGAPFTIQSLWNELILDDWPIKPRDYIRASEIGKPFLDRYLTMKGVPPTNPFPARVKRIFDCGLIFEDAVERIFRLLGILIDSQATVRVKRDGLLDVVGHYDQKIGGKVDISQAQEAINHSVTPDWMKRRATKLSEELARQHPQGFETLISEIKTVNSMAFWAHKNIDPATGFFKGYDHHKLQILTYLLGTGEEQGRVFYISKDDLTLMETVVMKHNKPLNEAWETDITQMTKYYKENKEPDKAPDLVWNEEKKLWGYNWEISRSTYFSLITGKKTVEAWENDLKDELKKLNTANCLKCEKPYTRQTLNKNKGYCAKCSKIEKQKKGGEKDE